MAKFFDRLEPEHVAFIERQHLFFVATASEGAHPNLSPKGYDTLQQYYDKKHAEVDWDAYIEERSRPQPPVAR